MEQCKRKLMVIEDNSHTRFLVTAILSSVGHEIIEADDGKIALDKLNDADIVEGLDAIFLDILMPHVNGLEVLKAIKSHDKLCTIPVLMLTTRDMAEDLILGYNSGADYYIPKPFTRQQLLYGLDLVLSGEASAEVSCEADDKPSPQ